MRMIGAALLAASVCGCASAGAATSDDVPNPFPDLPIGDLSGFGPDGHVTAVFDPQNMYVVAGDPPLVLWRKDPANGCALSLADDLLDNELMSPDEQAALRDRVHPDATFFDQCHGNQYDIGGAPLHDPDSRPMNAVPTEVRDGTLFWTRDEVRERFVEELEGAATSGTDRRASTADLSATASGGRGGVLPAG